MDDEREQNSWLGKTLRQSSAAAGEACLDAETLAAWVDGGLGAKAAAEVELHASTCPRCTAVLAAMERSAPAAAARHTWTRARLFRWLIPLTAAATAIAIWVAVPDRPVTTSLEELARTSEQAVAPAPPAVPGSGLQVPVPVPVPEAAPVPGPPPERATAEPRTGNDSVEPGTRTRNVEPQAPADFRDELRRENAAPETPGASSGAAAAPRAASPAAPPSADRESAAPTTPTDTLAVETASPAAERFALSTSDDVSTESIAPANPMIRWRVTTPRRIERSTNGAKTWSRTTVPPGSLVGIRAVDANRAVVRASDNTEFYTVDAGRSWTRVQENSAAPF